MMDIGSFFIIAIGAIIYFIPAANAYSRKHKSAAAITAANLFFGWTILGWLLCLVWSYSGNTQAADPGAPSPETHVRCPECRELVIRDARKCKHCGCALIPQ
jgi:hypothetical protein